MTTTNALRTRLPALAFGVAGILFVLYPAVRPFSDESTLQGAASFASSAWLLAHSLAMVGFILLALGLLGVYGALRESAAGGLALVALIVTWFGAGLTLPYYGAETFALHAVGQEAARRHDADLLVTLTNAIRYGEGVWFFAPGLLALAVGTILMAIAVWRSGVLVAWSALPLAVGFALFIPQFFTSQPVRVGHGLLVMVGCATMAWGMLSQREVARPRRVARAA